MSMEKRFMGNNVVLASLAYHAEGTDKISERKAEGILNLVIADNSNAHIEILQTGKGAIDFEFVDEDGNACKFQLVFMGKVFVLISEADFCEDMASAIAMVGITGKGYSWQ